MEAVAFDTGRCYMGRLTHGADVLTAVEAFCVENGVDTAIFTMIGALTCVTLGTYDQNQQVYVTFKKEGPLEIVHCTGNVSYKEDKKLVHAHAVMATEDGHTLGGHLFSESLIFAGEIFLRELVGPRLNREYDEQTGLWLWGTP